MADTFSTHILQKLRGLALMAISFQTLGVVYGDLGAQPLHLESFPVGDTSVGLAWSLQSNAVPASCVGCWPLCSVALNKLYPIDSAEGHARCQVLQPVGAILMLLCPQAPALYMCLPPFLRSSQMRRIWWGQSPLLCGH